MDLAEAEADVDVEGVNIDGFGAEEKGLKILIICFHQGIVSALTVGLSVLINDPYHVFRDYVPNADHRWPASFILKNKK